jgi:hypothetical protein
LLVVLTSFDWRWVLFAASFFSSSCVVLRCNNQKQALSVVLGLPQRCGVDHPKVVFRGTKKSPVLSSSRSVSESGVDRHASSHRSKRGAKNGSRGFSDFVVQIVSTHCNVRPGTLVVVPYA